jgi:spore germination protein GerM
MADAPRRGPTILAIINLTVLIFLLVAAVVILCSRRRESKETPPPPAAPAAAAQSVEGVMTATLFFGRDGAEGLVAEAREIAVSGPADDAVRRVIAELARGPAEGGAPVLPPGTALLRAFRGEEGTLFLDFNRDFHDAHWGGSQAEEMTLRALTSTIAANFPDVREVQILVEGAALQTLAGHVAIDAPIPVRP